jgi:hypothetical protein
MTSLDIVLQPSEPDITGAAAQAASPISAIYAEWAPIYREAGFWPVPITPGSKACHMANWQAGMTDADFAGSLAKYATYGIGLLMGSPFEDGTTLAALDVDDDQYIEVSKALLGNPPCIRRGRKGVGIFVRVQGEPRYVAFKARGARQRHSELLACKKVLVLPPTIHPELGQPYEWLTPPLLDVDYRDLPLIKE